MATSLNNNESNAAPELAPEANAAAKVQPATATAAAGPNTAGANKKQSSLEKIAIILFLLLLTAGAFFLIYTFVKQPDKKTGGPELTPAATAAVPSGVNPTVAASQKTGDFPTSAWEGKYLRTVLPSGWKIIEYENGEGTSSLAAGVNYRGLTGFAVMDSSDVQAFSAEAAYGIGGIGCDKIFRFADTDPQYLAGLVETNKEVGLAGSIVDLTAKNYFAYALFGTPARRVLTDLYYDAEPGQKAGVFNPACGANAFLPVLVKGPYFESSTSVSAPVWEKHQSYRFAITANTANADLLKLDEVLKNLETL